MTSHFINYFVRRLEAFKFKNKLFSTDYVPKGEGEVHSGEAEKDCVFCEIVKGNESAHVVYEDEWVIAFLDILPIRPFHLLVVPKKHYARLTHLPDGLAREMGNILPRLSRALCAAAEQEDFNVVSNQGYAQIVHHLHIHLVPAPDLRLNQVRSGWSSIVGREELDEEEGAIQAAKIRSAMIKQNRLEKL